MRNLVLILLITTMVSSCTQDETIYGSGSLVSEFRSVQPFSKIYSEGVFEVTITQGAIQSVEIIGDDNVIHKVRTTVTNNQLKLSLTDDNFRNIKLKANITVPDLHQITNEGIGDITASGFMDSGTFKITNTGTADVTVRGSSENLDILNEGSGGVHTFNFIVENGTVENVGSGNIEVNCSSTLNIRIEGSGNVYYKGEPSVNANVNGSGSVIEMN